MSEIELPSVEELISNLGNCGDHNWVRQAFASGEAREAREACHLSITAMAAVARVHQTTYGRWESGDRSPDHRSVSALAPTLRLMVSRYREALARVHEMRERNESDE